MDNFDFLAQIWPKMDLGSEIHKTNVEIRMSIPQIPDVSTLTFFGPNLPKNGLLVQNFKNLSLDLESTPPIHHTCQFLVKMENF